MKKHIATATILLAFSLTVLADGDLGTGGKSCSSNCFANQQTTVTKEDKTTNKPSVLSWIQTTLAELFS